jgi:hypothetical protein
MAYYNSDPQTPLLLRRLASEYPDLFFTAAAKYLQSEVESQAYRFLAALLVRQESFFERLANPGRCPCESAVQLFKRLLAVDPFLDFKLARMLPGRNDANPDRVLTGGHAVRAIDILDQTSTGQRLLPVIGHLPNSADARIAAKATLFVGRRVNNPAWIAKQMLSEDDRLRANAVEGAWGTTSDDAIRILKSCVEDANNRVAGNALIGLHRAGCPGVAEHALAMSESKEPGRRSTAAWAMGKIGSPAFIDRLTALLRDQHPNVRSTAIRSLVAIGHESKRLDATAAMEKPVEPEVPEPAGHGEADPAACQSAALAPPKWCGIPGI